MKRFVLTMVVISLSSSVFAQQPPQPTKQHEILKKDVGTWTGTMKMFLAGPDGDPIVMPIKETNTMMSPGLWLVSKFESGPFQGRGQFGYDPLKKKYVGTWIDNMTPHLSVMVGEFDADKGVMTMFSEVVDPTTGTTKKTKSVSRFDGDDKRNFVMYSKTDGNWVKSFEINYQRAE